MYGLGKNKNKNVVVNPVEDSEDEEEDEVAKMSALMSGQDKKKPSGDK
jgi:hypothetical protein